ncbi:MAG: ribosome assembly RNA-binding protein YhbY [Methylohalobius sp. ZOD2]
MEARLKRTLRSRAHHLKPVVMTGQNGISEAVLAEIDLALDHHELIKVRLSAGDRQARKEMAAHICERLEAELVQLLGHVATFYRENPDK